jgi:hypothetical protein
MIITDNITCFEKIQMVNLLEEKNQQISKMLTPFNGEYIAIGL